MERRSSPRVKAHFPCEIRRSKDRASGTVLDMSEGGLSVESQLSVGAGDPLVVRLQLPHQRESLELEATVWHVRRTKHRRSGERCWILGLLLTKAPDAYLELLPNGNTEELPASGATTEPGTTERERPRAEPDGLQPFRIRVKLCSEPRTRLLTLSAESEAEAQALALTELDDEWEVLEVFPAPRASPRSWYVTGGCIAAAGWFRPALLSLQRTRAPSGWAGAKGAPARCRCRPRGHAEEAREEFRDVSPV